MDLKLVITGSYPPDICGVGDYTSNVMATATAKDWLLYHRKNWRPGALFEIIREINTLKPREIFMQYPTQGYGWSLVPHLICMYYSLFSNIRFTVVLHEFSQLSIKAHAAASLMVKTANRLIFTNEFEQATAQRTCSSVMRRSKIVKIASNIPTAAHRALNGNREIDLAYFGHIRPRKGIETFLEVAKLARARHPDWRLLLMGQCPPGFEVFAADILFQCQQLGIEVQIDLDSEAVARVLSNVNMVYLPFPDGISERRGTAMAAMANGALVLTTAGKHTTPALAGAVCISSHLQAMDQIELLRAQPSEQLEAQRQAGRDYLRQHIPTTWEAVARAYLD